MLQSSMTLQSYTVKCYHPAKLHCKVLSPGSKVMLQSSMILQSYTSPTLQSNTVTCQTKRHCTLLQHLTKQHRSAVISHRFCKSSKSLQKCFNLPALKHKHTNKEIEEKQQQQEQQKTKLSHLFVDI